MVRRTAVICAFVTLAGALAPMRSAQAAPGDSFDVVATLPFAGSLTVGPDGNLWAGGLAEVFRITPTGSVTAFPLPGAAREVVSLDGSVWALDNGALFEIDPGTGAVASFVAPPQGENLIAGPDGHLWYLDRPATIVRVSTSGTAQTFTLPDPQLSLGAMTSGPDGAVWFTEHGFDEGQVPKVGRISPSGTITEFPVPSQRLLSAIGTGSDGNLWIAAELEARSLLRMTPTGEITSFPAGDSLIFDLTPGPQGALWARGRVEVQRIAPDGTLAHTSAPRLPQQNDHRLTDIVAGPDGRIWYLQETGMRNARTWVGAMGMAATRVDVTVTPTNGPAGAPTDLRAAVSAPFLGTVPTGTVDFHQKTIHSNTYTFLGSADLVEGVAQLTTGLQAGVGHIRATYRGDGTHLAQLGDADVFQVDATRVDPQPVQLINGPSGVVLRFRARLTHAGSGAPLGHKLLVMRGFRDPFPTRLCDAVTGADGWAQCEIDAAPVAEIAGTDFEQLIADLSSGNPVSTVRLAALLYQRAAALALLGYEAHFDGISPYEASSGWGPLLPPLPPLGPLLAGGMTLGL